MTPHILHDTRIHFGGGEHARAKPGWLLASLFLSMLMISGCGSPVKRELRLGISPGSTYELAIETDSRASRTLEGVDSLIFRSQGSWRIRIHGIEADEAGNIVADAHIVKARAPLFAQAMANIFTDRTFQLVLTPSGRIVEFRNTDVLRAETLDAWERAGGDDKNPHTRDAIEYLLRDAVLRTLLEPILSVWPPLPVSQGDAWNREPLYFAASDTWGETHFELVKLSEGGAVVSFNTTFVPADTVEFPPREGAAQGEIIVRKSLARQMEYRETRRISGKDRDGSGTIATVTDIHARLSRE